MLLAIDAGNTNVVAAIMANSNVVHVERYDTEKGRDEKYHYEILNSFLNKYEIEISALDGAVISSVVPEINNYLGTVTDKILGKKPLFVSHELNTGLEIRYDNPSKLGADLITGAAGALKKFGCPVIIIDIGTATTFSVVGAKSEYLGGMIAPGPYTALRALSATASQLPGGELGMCGKVIGTNTADCMSIGAFTAHAAMIDGMIDRIIEQTDYEKITLVATGGPARDITCMCKHDIIYDRDLVLYGLYEIFYMNE